MSSNITTKRLDNVVYLLGAGFSAPLGIPVMNNFLQKSKDMFAVAPDQYRNFGKVFDTINEMSIGKNHFNSNLFNIEEILSILEMSEELSSNETERSLFKEYIIDVVQYYTPKLEFQGYSELWQYSVFGKENLNFNYYGSFVGSLLSLAVSNNSERDFFCNRSGEPNRPARYSVITLNYDTILENCFSYLMNHFHADSKIGFSREIEQSEEKFLQNTHLAKLHGSVDTKVIVPPTWNKGLHEQIKPAWRLAYKVLTEANHIRIIGYSLPAADAYVRYLLKAAIIHCENLKSIDVLCLDRDGSVKDRYDELICSPNYKFKNGSIVDYLVHNNNECLKESKGGSNLHMNCLEATHKEFFDK